MTGRILIEALITTQVLSHIQVNTKNPGVTFLGIWKFKRVGEAARCFSSWNTCAQRLNFNQSRHVLHTYADKIACRECKESRHQGHKTGSRSVMSIA